MTKQRKPSWGRFINPDAIIGSVGELLGPNVFAYCKNNSINLIHVPISFRMPIPMFP